MSLRSLSGMKLEFVPDELAGPVPAKFRAYQERVGGIAALSILAKKRRPDQD
jgi:hypothetical protein